MTVGAKVMVNIDLLNLEICIHLLVKRSSTNWVLLTEKCKSQSQSLDAWVLGGLTTSKNFETSRTLVFLIIFCLLFFGFEASPAFPKGRDVSELSLNLRG